MYPFLVAVPKDFLLVFSRYTFHYTSFISKSPLLGVGSSPYYHPNFSWPFDTDLTPVEMSPGTVVDFESYIFYIEQEKRSFGRGGGLKVNEKVSK